MRIVAGQFRGRALASLGKGNAAAHLRPTTDRVRESLFNVLANMAVLAGARVLDLFAGTGALGLEALSRGADHVCFVDNGRKALSLIAKNVALTGSEAQTQILRQDAARLGVCNGAAFDLIFLDPPYGMGLGQQALDAARARGWIAPGALIVWEDNAPMPVLPGLTLADRRRYGDTHVTMLWAEDQE